MRLSLPFSHLHCAPSLAPGGRVLVALALALACASVVPLANAALYKWTDANGRVVYSDQPPLGDVKTEILRAPAPAGNPDALKDLANKDVELRKKQAEAADSAKKAETKRADAEKRAEMCTRVAGQIKMLSADQVSLVRQNTKGEVVVIDETTRRRQRAELEIWIKANCQPA